MNGIKTFFLAFFTHKSAKGAAKLYGTGIILGVLAALVLLFGGAITGYVASFDSHYGAASEFRDFAYSAIKETNAKLTLKNGSLYSESLINTFKSGGNGYGLIVDTRPDLDDLFDDCDVYYKNGSDEIDYEDWLKLGDEKNNYKLCVEYSGRALDTAAKQAKYLAYLNMLSDKDSQNYNEIAAKRFSNINSDRDSGRITERQYADRIYTLYFSIYYPTVSEFERYAVAPTLRQYYADKIAASKGRALMLTQKTGRAYFINSNGIELRVEGDYGSDALEISADDSEKNIRAGIDKLIKGMFEANRASDVGAYVLNILTASPWIALAVLVCVSVIAITLKLRGIAHPSGFKGMLKTVGTFFFVSAAITFGFAVLVAFFLSRTAAFYLAIGIFAAVLNIRTIVYAVTEAIKAGPVEPEAKPLPLVK